MVQASWIDPDTPEQYHTTQPLTPDDQREFQLVGARSTIQLCDFHNKQSTNDKSNHFAMYMYSLSN